MTKPENIDNQTILSRFLISKDSLSPRSKEYYTRELGDFLEDVNKPVWKITPEDIELHIASLTTRSAVSKDSRYRAIWSFYSWLFARGYITRNLFKEKLVARPQKPKKIQPHLTEKQVRTLLAAAPDQRTRALIGMLADTGCRISEIMNIRRQDIDLDKREVIVTGKGNKQRFAFFGPVVAALLKLYLDENRFPEYPNIWGVKCRWNFTHMLAALEKKTGIKCNPHSFRRTLAIHLREHGVDHMAIQYIGGWDDLEEVALVEIDLALKKVQNVGLFLRHQKLTRNQTTSENYVYYTF